MVYLLLGTAVLSGVVGSTALKLSDGLQRPLPLLGTVAGYGVATVALGLLMEHLAVGVIYAVWGGGAALSLTVVGQVVFGERITARGLAGVGLIVSGVALIHLAGAL